MLFAARQADLFEFLRWSAVKDTHFTHTVKEKFDFGGLFEIISERPE